MGGFRCGCMEAFVKLVSDQFCSLFSGYHPLALFCQEAFSSFVRMSKMQHADALLVLFILAKK
uniref:Uncharacterized protein n=1 Tax=Aegilops tauschii subsp. strangulata TaxID=200361 RepID=A0A453LEL2_AEGTS